MSYVEASYKYVFKKSTQAIVDESTTNNIKFCFVLFLVIIICKAQHILDVFFCIKQMIISGCIN